MTKSKSTIYTGRARNGEDPSSTSNADYGAGVVIRYPKMGDVRELWKYVNKISREKTYVSNQGKRISLKKEGVWLEKNLEQIKKRQGVFLLTFVGQQMIGICGIRLGQKIKQHAASLFISIDKDYRGQGLGKLLMSETMKEAEKKLKGLKIITLEVFAENDIAKNLYLKLGFKEFGYLPEGLVRAGQYSDEIYMYKKM